MRLIFTRPKLVALCVLFTLAIAKVCAVTTTDGGVTYTLYSSRFLGNYAVVTCVDNSSSVVIKDKITDNGTTYDVNSIGIEAFAGCETLEAITIPQNVVVGAGAFYGCTGLKSITIPSEIAFGQLAFEGCTSLSEIYIKGVMSSENVNTLNSILPTTGTTRNFYIPIGSSASYSALSNANLVECIVTIGSTGYATICSATSALDFTGTGITPYIVTNSPVISSENGSTKVSLEAISDYIVPNQEGVILQGTAGTYIINTTDDKDKISGNLLIGTTERTQLTNGEYTCYILAVLKDSELGVGFSKVVSGTYLAAGKAYLQDNASSGINAASLEFTFGEATSIDEIEATNGKTTGETYYTLSGLRVDNPTKGLYVKKGQKVFIK